MAWGSRDANEGGVRRANSKEEVASERILKTLSRCLASIQVSTDKYTCVNKQSFRRLEEMVSKVHMRLGILPLPNRKS